MEHKSLFFWSSSHEFIIVGYGGGFSPSHQDSQRDANVREWILLSPRGNTSQDSSRQLAIQRIRLAPKQMPLDHIIVASRRRRRCISKISCLSVRSWWTASDKLASRCGMASATSGRLSVIRMPELTGCQDLIRVLGFLRLTLIADRTLLWDRIKKVRQIQWATAQIINQVSALNRTSQGCAFSYCAAPACGNLIQRP